MNDRPKRRGRNTRKVERESGTKFSLDVGMRGGQFKPLQPADLDNVHQAALEILEKTGVGNVWPEFHHIFENAGGWITGGGRVCLPGGLIERAIDQAAKSVVIHGQNPEQSIELKPESVHISTGGIGVFVFDTEERTVRDSALADVYDCTRMADAMENIHCIGRQLVARDMKTVDDLDINTTYAMACATTKPFGAGVNRAANVSKVARMMDVIMGSDGAFRKAPICWSGATFMVSPLRIQDEEQNLLQEMIKEGFPVLQISVPQAGTSGPARLVDTLALAVAETLFVLTWVNLLKPGHPMIVGCWPFVSDLRTGAFSGGGAEQALLMSASAQMMNYYGLPNSIAAGMSDAKEIDFQSGSEKSMSMTGAALSGSSLVFAYPGLLASIMGFSYDQMILDNELLGTVLRALKGIEVRGDLQAPQVVHDCAVDPGHFISHPQTMALMEKEYLYPELADRRSINAWLEDVEPSITERARQKATDVLRTHFPNHIAPAAHERIREMFNIQITCSRMQKES